MTSLCYAWGQFACCFLKTTCSVRNTQCMQSSRNEDNMGRWFFSHWHSRLWRKTLSTPDRRRTYGLLITSPDALPQSYKTFFGARDTKLGLCDKHPAILLQGSQSENTFHSDKQLYVNFSYMYKDIFNFLQFHLSIPAT